MLSKMKIRTRLLLVALGPATAMAVTTLGPARSGGAGLAAGVSAVGVLAAAGLALAVTRSITAPVNRLGDAAERGARLQNLVEVLRRPGARDEALALAPIGLDSADEIGRAARAFDSFQGSAAKLAVQQAALLNKGVADKGTIEVFVNLARRMQSLVDHQIEFLDGLEATEQDPDTLENLFKLDQLATRVRRNAESLLTMAGAAAGRSWERPLSMTDVIRAGIAEVEELGRVDLVSDQDALLLGNVAADAAHLLSELLENATRWSPPDTRVEVRGEPRLGGYEIRIVDAGIGMEPDALAEANHILTGPALAGTTVARSLGLVVTGRLAKRLGITVHLAAAETGGVAATVLVPPSLMVAGDTAEGQDAESGSARTLPFALARQEKRARISSQRRRGAPRPPTTTPGSTWYDDGESARIIQLPDPRPPAAAPAVRIESPRPRPAVEEPPATARTGGAPVVGAGDDEPEWIDAAETGDHDAPAVAVDDVPDVEEAGAPAAEEPGAPVSVSAAPDAVVTGAVAAPEEDRAGDGFGPWTGSLRPPRPPAAEPPAAPAGGLPPRRIPSVPRLPSVEGPTPPTPRPIPPVPAFPGSAVAPNSQPPRPVPVQRPVRFAGGNHPPVPGAADRPPGGPRSSAEDDFQRHLERATANGLVRRVPKASLPPDTGRGSRPAAQPTSQASTGDRLPDEVRSLLSSYRSGVERGRSEDADLDQTANTHQERS